MTSEHIKFKYGTELLGMVLKPCRGDMSHISMAMYIKACDNRIQEILSEICDGFAAAISPPPPPAVPAPPPPRPPAAPPAQLPPQQLEPRRRP